MTKNCRQCLVVEHDLGLIDSNKWIFYQPEWACKRIHCCWLSLHVRTEPRLAPWLQPCTGPSEAILWFLIHRNGEIMDGVLLSHKVCTCFLYSSTFVFEVYFSGFRVLCWQFLFHHSKDVILLSFALCYFWYEVRSHSGHCSPVCDVYFSLAAFTIFLSLFSSSLVWCKL